MTTELLDLARRVVAACPEWYLPGIVAVIPSDIIEHYPLSRSSSPLRIDDYELKDGCDPCVPGKWVPDLSDELTALGLLVLVRRKRNDPRLTTLCTGWSNYGPICWEIGKMVVNEDGDGYGETRWEPLPEIDGFTELEVLVAALESHHG